MNLGYTVFSISCLIFGFYFGFRIGKDKEIPKEITHPIETFKINKKEKMEEKEQDEKLKELQQDLEELDNYNADIL
ncbi:MAG: hypothetical protein HFJ34_05260 [Clostridia bacterium]|nr:hypothetical protein [Clostridia bacterium]